MASSILLSVAFFSSMASGVLSARSSVATDGYEFNSFYGPNELWTLAQSFRSASRPTAETDCALFVDQRSVKTAGALYDKILEIPLPVQFEAQTVYDIHLNLHSSFVQSDHSGTVVNSDLIIGISDGQNLYGFMRASPKSHQKFWAVPVKSTVGRDSLNVRNTVVRSDVGAHCSHDLGCSVEGSEGIHLVFRLEDNITAFVASHLATTMNQPGQFQFPNDVRGKVLSIMLFAGDVDNAYSLAAAEVRIMRSFRSSKKDISVNAQLASVMWPASSLIPDGVDHVHASFSDDRSRRLVDKCRIEFSPAPLVPGISFSRLVSVPLLPAGALTSRKDYVFHIAVSSDGLTPRNNLLVGIADGVSLDSHIVGFVRGDSVSNAIGRGFSGRLSADDDMSLFIRSSSFEEVPTGEGSLPSTFQVDIIVNSGYTRVLANAGSILKSGDVFFSNDKGQQLNMKNDLYLVLMQGTQYVEASSLRYVGVTVDEVVIGCDGVPHSGKEVDRCGVCGGANECVGCDGQVNSGKILDICGLCNGDGKSCLDCAGTPFGVAVLDECGICGGANACLVGKGASTEKVLAFQKRAEIIYAGQNAIDVSTAQTGVFHAQKEAAKRDLTKCAVGDACDPVDCAGVPFRDGGHLVVDNCGVCGGNNTCIGCDGLPGGKQFDACGVCGGSNTTCCNNYLNISNNLWNFLLLPITLDNIVEKLECSRSVIEWMLQNFPDFERLNATDADMLYMGRMAEFNRVFIDECIVEFNANSGKIYSQLVEDNIVDPALPRTASS